MTFQQVVPVCAGTTHRELPRNHDRIDARLAFGVDGASEIDERENIDKTELMTLREIVASF